MKKIGIMSMQRIANYGSFLQAYGLKTAIEELGYNVEFVDYEYETPIIKQTQKIVKFTKKLKHIFHIKKKLKIKKEWSYFQKEYKKYIKKYFNISDKKNIRPKDINKLIIGSDEVFNCMQGYPVGYSKELFGKNYQIDVFSYAASFGYTNMDLINEYHIDKELSSMLNKFKSISVRDKNSYQIIKSLTNKLPTLNLDPVLVSNFNYEKDIKLKNYIIVYTYPGRLNKKEEKYIKKFAKKHNKKILSIGFYQNIADINLYVDPLDLLSYFKQADFIITDTFHGSIFSIKTNSKFCTIIRKSNENKLVDLLTRLELNNRVVHNLKEIDNMYNTEIDFSKTNDIIKKERENSINYLKKNLK